MTARILNISKWFKVGLIVLCLSLLGAGCKQSPSNQTDANNFKEVALTDLYQVLQKTAADLGREPELIEINKENPTMMFYNGFRIIFIQKIQSNTESELKRIGKMFGLEKLELNSFAKDVCKVKSEKYGAGTSLSEISGYQACNYSGELITGPYQGTVILVGNYILTSDKPPAKRKNVLNKETEAYEQVLVEGWSWDHQGATQILVNNFLEKFK